MSSRKSVILGFFVAVSIPPMHLALAALPNEPGIESIIDGVLFLAVAFAVFLPYAALVGTLVGIPAYLACKRFGLLAWWMAVLVGSAAGLLATFVTPTGIPAHIQLLQYVLLGALAGIAFWIVFRLAEREN